MARCASGRMVIANIINGFTAFGTIAVAVTAIWGGWFRSKLAPAKLALVEHTPEGDPTTFYTARHSGDVLSIEGPCASVSVTKYF